MLSSKEGNKSLTGDFSLFIDFNDTEEGSYRIKLSLLEGVDAWGESYNSYREIASELAAVEIH